MTDTLATMLAIFHTVVFIILTLIAAGVVAEIKSRAATSEEDLQMTAGATGLFAALTIINIVAGVVFSGMTLDQIMFSVAGVLIALKAALIIRSWARSQAGSKSDSEDTP